MTRTALPITSAGRFSSRLSRSVRPQQGIIVPSPEMNFSWAVEQANRMTRKIFSTTPSKRIIGILNKIY
jgi:hypothetical protein